MIAAMVDTHDTQDVLVLGAGMVGVSCALHLRRKGLSVALLDKQAPGLATSYGNAGLIQREAIAPYELPRDLAFLCSGLLNQRVDMQYHLNAVLGQVATLYAYFRHSAPARHREAARAYETLIAHCIETHVTLIGQADANDLVAEKTGFLALCRTTRALHKLFATADTRAAQGVNHSKLTPAELVELEPFMQQRFVGAVHWTDTLPITNPGALVQAYAHLFKREGGAVLLGDATTLQQVGATWQVQCADGNRVQAKEVLIALGPWSTQLTARFGYKPPLFVKRGYHMHYAHVEGRPLQHWVMDYERGYMVCPMQQGIRLTTGAELAWLDAPRTPRQLAMAETIAKNTFPLGNRVDDAPWMGARPCLPDMNPVLGAVPRQTGLWCAFGHGHQGFTLGPITGELMAAQMTGASPRVDMTPFTPARFA